MCVCVCECDVLGYNIKCTSYCGLQFKKSLRTATLGESNAKQLGGMSKPEKASEAGQLREL